MGHEHVRGAGSLSRNAGVIRRTAATRPLTLKATRPHCRPTATRIPGSSRVGSGAENEPDRRCASRRTQAASRPERATGIAAHVVPGGLGRARDLVGLKDYVTNGRSRTALLRSTTGPAKN